MAGGIGDFSVTTGKNTAGSSNPSLRKPGNGFSHYIILTKQGWEQTAPLRFHNGYLDDLRTKLRVSAKVPLPEMPNFFPSGAEGEMVFQGRHVLHLDSALREQPLFAHLETLRDLVQRCADRKTTFPDFIASLNQIPIPSAWRNEIVNGLFENAQAPSAPVAPKAPGLSQDIEKLMGMLNEGDSGGSKLSPHLGKFLEEVGRDSTGFTLRDGAAKQLHKDLVQTLTALRGSFLQHGALADALGFLSSLQRLAKTAKGRERQTVHLWSDIPQDPVSLLVGDNADEGGNQALALVLLDPWDRDPGFLRKVGALAAQLDCALLVQLSTEEIKDGDAGKALSESVRKTDTYFFAGGVASQVDGDFCVFRPAALAFLEGLVSSRESVDFYLHRSMQLEDQDLFTEKGQARSADRLLDQTQVQTLSDKRINRVNGVRNRGVAAFPLLTAWADRG